MRLSTVLPTSETASALSATARSAKRRTKWRASRIVRSLLPYTRFREVFMRLVRFAAFALVFAATLPLSADEEKIPENEYYPLAVGTTWTYEAGGGQTVKVKVAEHEKIRGTLCARFETSFPGNTVSEHITIKEDGVYRHSYAGVKIDPPVRFMKLPIKKGDTWKVESKQGEQELKGKFTVDEESDVDVPAGTFDKTVKISGKFTVKVEGANQEFETTCWYAKGRGLIKQEFNSGGQIYTIELKKFTKGSGKADEEKKDDEKKDDDKKDEKKDEKKPDDKKQDDKGDGKKKGDF
jgi:hypothetical protein